MMPTSEKQIFDPWFIFIHIYFSIKLQTTFLKFLSVWILYLEISEFEFYSYKVLIRLHQQSLHPYFSLVLHKLVACV